MSYNISRVTVQGGFGASDARFHDFLLDARSLFTGSAVNTLIIGRNTGGKTSLISFMLYVFLNRWLQSEQQGRQHAPDARHISKNSFFPDDKLVFIAMEFERSTERMMLITPESDKIVLGVAVQRVQNNYNQFFFGFETNDKADFESLPIARFNNEPVSTLTEFKRWFATRIEPVADEAFGAEHYEYRSQQQRSWKARLESRWVNPQFAQILFGINSTEGGDKKILDWDRRSFLVFLIKSMIDKNSLTYFADIIDGLRQKKQRAPLMEKTVELYGSIIDSLDAMRESVIRSDEYRREIAQLKAEINLLSLKLGAAKSFCMELNNSARRELENVENERKNLSAMQATLKRDCDSVEVVILNRDIKNANMEISNLKYSAVGLAARMDALVFAAKTIEKNEFNAALDKYTRNLRKCDETRKVTEAATRLWRKFQIEISLREDILKSKVGTERQQRENLSTTREACERANLNRDKMKKLYIELNSKKNFIETQLAQLVDDGYMRAHENLSEAWQRLDVEKANLLIAKNLQEAEAVALSSSLKDCMTKKDELSFKVAGLQKEFEIAAKEYECGMRQREDLAYDDFLKRFVEEDVFNPDNPDAILWLKNDRLQTGKSLQKSLSRLAGARARYRDIEERGADCQWQETEKLIAELQQVHDIYTANSGFRYLAELRELAVNEARNLVAANPARYMGIIVNNEHDFLRIRNAAETLNPDFPVVVSLADSSIGSCDNFLTVMPKSNSLWNYEAAVAEKERLAGYIGKLEIEIEEFEQRISSIDKSLTNLSQYLQAWPDGLSSAYRDSIATSLSQAKSQRDEVMRENEVLLSDQDKCRIRLENIVLAQQQNEQARQRLANVSGLGDLAILELEILDTIGKLEETEKRISEFNQTRKNIERELSLSDKEIAVLNAEILSIRRQMEKVRHVDENIDVVVYGDVESLTDEYKNALGKLDNNVWRNRIMELNAYVETIDRELKNSHIEEKLINECVEMLRDAGYSADNSHIPFNNVKNGIQARKSELENLIGNKSVERDNWKYRLKKIRENHVIAGKFEECNDPESIKQKLDVEIVNNNRILDALTERVNVLKVELCVTDEALRKLENFELPVTGVDNIDVGLEYIKTELDDYCSLYRKKLIDYDKIEKSLIMDREIIRDACTAINNIIGRYGNELGSDDRNVVIESEKWNYEYFTNLDIFNHAYNALNTIAKLRKDDLIQLQKEIMELVVNGADKMTYIARELRALNRVSIKEGPDTCELNLANRQILKLTGFSEKKLEIYRESFAEIIAGWFDERYKRDANKKNNDFTLDILVDVQCCWHMATNAIFICYVLTRICSTVIDPLKIQA